MKTFFFNKATMLAVTLASTLLFTACGKQQHQLVKDVNLAAYTEEGEIYTEIVTTMDFGNMTLPSLELPVKHPKTSEQLGTVAMYARFDGLNEIKLDVNLSRAFAIQGQNNATLPNGTAIPVGGLGDTPIVALPIGDTQAKVYLALDSGVAVAGFAISIKEFAGIGNSVGTINFFPAFNIGDVRGTAGIYTSGNDDQNGLAFFVDLSSVVNPDDMLGDLIKEEEASASVSMLKSASVMSFAAPAVATPAAKTIYFQSQGTSSKKKKKMDNILYKLHQKKTHMNLN